MRNDAKQIIVIRRDLNMSAGKLAAQVLHASMAHIFNQTEINNDREEAILNIPENSAIEQWFNGSFTKVVVYVKSEQALLNVYEKAQKKSLPCALIKDEGRTEFNEPTHTCVGIGPCYPEDFDGVTNKLRLFDGEIIQK